MEIMLVLNFYVMTIGYQKLVKVKVHVKSLKIVHVELSA